MKKLSKYHLPLVTLLVAWGSYFSVLFYKILQIRPDGIYFGHINVWSDWSFHTAIANTFAFKPPSLWFAYHFLFADGQFTYPFLADMVTGLLLRLSLSLKWAFFLPSILTALALIIGLYFLGLLVTNSKRTSFLFVNFFFLSAGLGFINYFKDFFASPTWSTLLHPIKDYSALFRYDWYAGNVVVGLLLPQRPFLLGITLGIWSLVGLLFVLKKEPSSTSSKKILLIAGLVAGILPIVHPHILIALIITAGTVCFVNYKLWKLLLWYVLPAGLLSSILFFIFIYGGIANTDHFSFLLGWGAKGIGDWFVMWFLFWGLTIPLAILGFWMIRRTADRTTKYFYSTFFIIFILTNLFLLQPIRWDNSKLFWWVYIGLSLLVAVVINKMWQVRKFWTKSLAVILVIVMCLTGFIELLRLIQVDRHSYMETSRDDIELGLTLRSKTDPLARFLTQPSHNHFVMIWAVRPIFMGFTAWVHNYGFDSAGYEKDLKVMYAGGPEAKTLLKKHKISYVVIGSAEIKDLKADELYYRLNFPVAFENVNNRVYDTRSLFR